MTDFLVRRFVKDYEKTYEKYENEEDLNFGKQKNYPSRRKSTFQAARTAKHTTCLLYTSDAADD